MSSSEEEALNDLLENTSDFEQMERWHHVVRNIIFEHNYYNNDDSDADDADDEMYKATFDYANSDDHVFSFERGKFFNLIEELDEHWWFMQDEQGNHGLVPASYLAVNNFTESQVLQSLRKSMESITDLCDRQHRSLGNTERRNLQKLNENYEIIRAGNSLWAQQSSYNTTSSQQSSGDVIPPQQSLGDVIPPRQSSYDLISPQYSSGDVIPPRQSSYDIMSPQYSSGDVIPPQQSLGDVISPQYSSGDVIPPQQSSYGIMSPQYSSSDIIPPAQPKRQAPQVPNNAATVPRRARSTKQYAAPPIPSDVSSGYSRSTSAPVSPTSSTTATKSVASSKIYNIQVSHGDINHVQTNHVPSKSPPASRSSSSSRKDGRASRKSQKSLASESPYLLSVVSSSKSSDAKGHSSSNYSQNKIRKHVHSSDEAMGRVLTKEENNNKSNSKTSNPEIQQQTKGNESWDSLPSINSSNTNKHTKVTKEDVSVKRKTIDEKSIERSGTGKSYDLKALQGAYFNIPDSTSQQHSSNPLTTNRNDENLPDLRTTVSNTKELSSSSSWRNNSTATDLGSDSRLGDVASTDTVNSGSTLSGPSLTEFNFDSVFVDEKLGKLLVDEVRSRCTVNFNKALAAVRCVLHHLGTEVREIAPVTRKIEKQIEDDKLYVFKGSLANEDGIRFYGVLNKLTTHKEDSQQRNWALHEDYQTIKTLIDEVIAIMNEIDPSICRAILEEDENKYINDLVLYYQMEHRSKLRIALLHVFGCFCQLGEEFISAILCTVLPSELAQDMMQDQADIMKFLSSGLMLTMLFSTAEPVPYQHYVQFNDEFVHFVLDLVEDPPDNDTNDQIPDCLIGMLLAFNQHFKTTSSSTLIQVIKERRVFRTFTEKILILLNREADPVMLFDFVHPCPDSVLKFLIDVFSTKETSGIFFTNDLYVLFDIILRQLVNREEKDKVRTEYLSLFHSILNTTKYREHKRHADQFKRRFQQILKNHENESEVDIYIVREIMTRFVDLFDQ